jgi:hypothetical protein
MKTNLSITSQLLVIFITAILCMQCNKEEGYKPNNNPNPPKAYSLELPTTISRPLDYIQSTWYELNPQFQPFNIALGKWTFYKTAFECPWAVCAYTFGSSQGKIVLEIFDGINYRNIYVIGLNDTIMALYDPMLRSDTVLLIREYIPRTLASGLTITSNDHIKRFFPWYCQRLTGNGNCQFDFSYNAFDPWDIEDDQFKIEKNCGSNSKGYNCKISKTTIEVGFGAKEIVEFDDERFILSESQITSIDNNANSKLIASAPQGDLFFANSVYIDESYIYIPSYSLIAGAPVQDSFFISKFNKLGVLINKKAYNVKWKNKIKLGGVQGELYSLVSTNNSDVQINKHNDDLSISSSTFINGYTLNSRSITSASMMNSSSVITKYITGLDRYDYYLLKINSSGNIEIHKLDISTAFYDYQHINISENKFFFHHRGVAPRPKNKDATFNSYGAIYQLFDSEYNDVDTLFLQTNLNSINTTSPNYDDTPLIGFPLRTDERHYISLGRTQFGKYTNRPITHNLSIYEDNGLDISIDLPNSLPIPPVCI